MLRGVRFSSVYLYINYLPYVGHGVSWGRSGEKQAVQRLEGLVFMPQEWHKKKVMLCFNVAEFINEGSFILSGGSFHLQ